MMNPSLLVLILFLLVIVSYLLGSIKVIPGGYVAIVERLGKYKRTLKAGTNFVIPVLDTVLLETTREQLIDIAPWSLITRDHVSIFTDAVVYWRISNARLAYYEITNVKDAISNLVMDAVNREVEKRDINNILTAKEEISEKVREELNQVMSRWGVEMTKLLIFQFKVSNSSSEPGNVP